MQALLNSKDAALKAASRWRSSHFGKGAAGVTLASKYAPSSVGQAQENPDLFALFAMLDKDGARSEAAALKHLRRSKETLLQSLRVHKFA